MTQEADQPNKDFSELLFPPENNSEEFSITHSELEQITDAFKDEGFRKLFVEYVEEMQVCKAGIVALNRYI